jgi:hypothetical protein
MTNNLINEHPEDAPDAGSTPLTFEHLPILETTPENALTVEHKVRCTIVHTLVRGQAPACEATAHKLQQIWLDLHNNVTTKQQAMQQLDELVVGDIATWITDPITKLHFDEAIDAIRGM